MMGAPLGGLVDHLYRPDDPVGVSLDQLSLATRQATLHWTHQQWELQDLRDLQTAFDQFNLAFLKWADLQATQETA